MEFSGSFQAGSVCCFPLVPQEGPASLMAENPSTPSPAVHFLHFLLSLVLDFSEVILMLCRLLAAFLEATTRGCCGAEAAGLYQLGRPPCQQDQDFSGSFHVALLLAAFLCL